MVYIHLFDCFCKQQGSKILSGSSVNDISCHYPGGCGGNILYLSAYKGCPLLVYGWLWSSSTHITKDGRRIIVDALLTLISKMGQRVFRFLFLLKWWPIVCLWLCVSCRPPDYPGYMTNNCWRSVGAHFQNVVGRVCPFNYDQYGGQCIENKPWCTNINISRIRVAYLNVTINVKPETQNRGFEPTGLAKHATARSLMGTGPGLAPHESEGRVAWLFLTRTGAFGSVPTRTEAG